MIGGLLFRYWEGGTAVRSGNPNVYVNWAQKKRPGAPAPAPRAAEPEQAVLVPLPALCSAGRIGVTGQAPVAFVRPSQAAAGVCVAVPIALAARAAACQTEVRAALPDVLSPVAVSPGVHPEADAASLRRLDIIEHNRRAIAAIAAAMLADDD